jgi:hypothetical protein
MKNEGLFVTEDLLEVEKHIFCLRIHVLNPRPPATSPVFYSFFSICFETDLFVSVVSIWIRNTETKGTKKFVLVLRNKPKINRKR